jgi:sulfoxide reductase heme-binding subunit YedZ
MKYVLRTAIVLAALVPLIVDAWAFENHLLGRDPYRRLIRETGIWSLWCLAATLAMTPLRRITGWQRLPTFRRTLGLLAFFYATLHTIAYIVFDRVAALDVPQQLLSWAGAIALTASTIADVADKPFLAIGLAAFVAMLPLAATSSTAMIRRLGGVRWRRLHRLIYPIAIASLLHHWWPLPDRLRVDEYGLAIGTFLALRVVWSTRHAWSPVHAPVPGSPER